jgi:hypothetical protein
MIARAMVIKVNPGCNAELSRTFEQEIIPLFRKEKDFRGLLAFTVPNGTEALSLSLWDQKTGSNGCITGGLSALTALARIALGKSAVQICEVENPPCGARREGTGDGEGLEVTADLRVYQSALQPFQVATTRASTGRGFPLIWCLMNSLHV